MEELWELEGVVVVVGRASLKVEVRMFARSHCNHAGLFPPSPSAESLRPHHFAVYTAISGGAARPSLDHCRPLEVSLPMACQTRR